MATHVFAIQTGDSNSYPPCGIRISVHDTMKELIEDAVEFFGDAEGVTGVAFDRLAAAKTNESLHNAMTLLCPTRQWSIYSDEHGYVGD